MTLLQETGFLDYLSTITAKSVILFGSMVRWDWHSESDIDVFVYGASEPLEVGKYELKLKRDIQVFECRDKQDIKQFPEGLIKNILRGNTIKGTLDFVEVCV